MGTQTVLYVQTDDVQFVVDRMHDWLKKTQRLPIEKRNANSIFDVYDCFLLPEDPSIEGEFKSAPTMVAIGQDQDDWVTVHHNTFFEMIEIASELSGHFNGYAVSLNAQTVTDTWRLGVFQDGSRIRNLHWVGESGEWLLNEGTPFPFEHAPLGENIGTEAEPFYVFGHKEVSEYCSHLGLQIWCDDFEKTWTILSIFGVVSSRRQERPKEAPLPWWRRLFRN